MTQSTTTKHTPGPWRKAYRDGGSTYAMENDKGQIVFLIADDKREIPTLGDARLIAAAPEILEALIQCVARLPYGNESLDIFARGVIAKATGGEA